MAFSCLGGRRANGSRRLRDCQPLLRNPPKYFPKRTPNYLSKRKLFIKKDSKLFYEKELFIERGAKLFPGKAANLFSDTSPSWDSGRSRPLRPSRARQSFTGKGSWDLGDSVIFFVNKKDARPNRKQVPAGRPHGLAVVTVRSLVSSTRCPRSAGPTPPRGPSGGRAAEP